MAGKFVPKHDAKGRFTGVSIGGGKRKPISNPKVERRALSEHVTSMFARRGDGGRVAVTKFEPGAWSGEHATIRSQYKRGVRAKTQPHPRGGTWQPVLRAAGWKTTGYRLKPQ